jgi:hypothetical protein
VKRLICGVPAKRFVEVRDTIRDQFVRTYYMRVEALYGIPAKRFAEKIAICNKTQALKAFVAYRNREIFRRHAL